MSRHKSSVFTALILTSLIFANASCYSNESNSRWANAQRESTSGTKPAATPQVEQSPANNPARSSKPLPGGSFNKFFPAASDGYTTVASQEKEGFAEYKLKKDGKEMAMLAISDTVANPEAAQKFQGSTRTISGYPAIEQGSTATAVLVDNRFQVKVLSRNPAFTKNDREAWLQKFNLAGIANL
ncbi:MAG: hypothetical protein ABI954_04185 [Pyrinomonadaceae bacterium]